MSEHTIAVRITPAIDNEYQNRLPEFLPLQKLHVGYCVVTVAEAQEMLADAEFNSSKEAFDIGPYGMPLGTYRAYQALARQLRSKLEAR